MEKVLRIKNCDVKAFTREKAAVYTAFGWERGKGAMPGDLKHSKKQDVFMKRKVDYGMDAALVDTEKKFAKCDRKKHGKKVILGILSFILMIAFLAVAAFGLYLGISAILDEKKDDATAQEESSIKTMLNDINEDYFSKVTSLLDGKEDDDTDGIVVTLKDALGEDIGKYITADILVGIVALILAIIFIIWFAEVAKQPKKKKKNEAKKAELRQKGAEIVAAINQANPSLMSKMDRKRYMWETIITNSLRNAYYGNMGPMSSEDEDDDD